MNPGDALAARVREFVTTQVPPAQVESVTLAVGHTIAILMADPSFIRELRVFQDLIQENQWLKNQILQQQRVIALLQQTTLSRDKIAHYIESGKAAQHVQEGFFQASGFSNLEAFKKRSYTGNTQSIYQGGQASPQVTTSNATGQFVANFVSKLEKPAVEHLPLWTCYYCGEPFDDEDSLYEHEDGCSDEA